MAKVNVKKYFFHGFSCSYSTYFWQELGGRCRKCKCNNNTDPAVRRNCDIITGECINCMYNTTGFNCEWCAPEFHGNALDKTCSRTYTSQVCLYESVERLDIIDVVI